MQITNERIRLTHSTTYCQRVIATEDEVRDAYMGFVNPQFLRDVVIGVDVDAVIDANRRRRSTKSSVRAQQLSECDVDGALSDVVAFSTGDIELVSLVFKYNIDRGELRKFFVELLPNEDINGLWSKHRSIAHQATTMDIYGVPHVTQAESVKAKREATIVARYGVPNAMQVPKFRESHRKAMLENHGVEFNFQRINEGWRESFLSDLCECDGWADLPSDFQIYRKDFIPGYGEVSRVEALLGFWRDVNGSLVSYPDNPLFDLVNVNRTWLKQYRDAGLCLVDEKYLDCISSYEYMVEQALDEFGVSYVRNNRTTIGLELDFYIPELNLAIEVNPSSTHNSNEFALSSGRAFHGLSKSKSVDYHYDKYIKCRDIGITLIQLFEYDMVPSVFETVTKPRLRHAVCGCDVIDVSDVDLVSITDEEGCSFLSAHHMRGACSPAKCYGFVKSGELIGVAAVEDKGGEFSLSRLCFKQGVQVAGVLQAVVARFFSDFQSADALVAYSDNNYGSGGFYAESGAEFVGETGPSLVLVSHSDPTDRLYDETDRDVEYVELYKPHQTDDKLGYDRIFTPGYKIWKFKR